MNIFKIFTKAITKEIPACTEIHFTSIICSKCGAIAFTVEDTPKWMTKGYCFRCGQLLKWDTLKKGEA